MTSPPEAWPLIMFPDALATGMILASLALSALGALVLIGLLIRDSKKQTIW